MSVVEPAGSPIGLNFFIPIDDALRVLALAPIPSADLRAAAAAPAPTAGPVRKKR